METTLYVKVKIKVESDLPIDEIINEFSYNSFYNFESTENVEVLETEFLETSTQPD